MNNLAHIIGVIFLSLCLSSVALATDLKDKRFFGDDDFVKVLVLFGDRFDDDRFDFDDFDDKDFDDEDFDDFDDFDDDEDD